jgi:hypothetical protein
MRAVRWGSSFGLIAALAAPAMGAGLQVDPNAWPIWQVRLQLSLNSANGLALEPAMPRAARLLGDYYLPRLRLGPQSAVRLTSGVLIGTRDALLDPAPQRAAWSSGVGQFALSRTAAMVPRIPDPAGDSVVTRPYLGLGYSAGDLRAGWGFSADVGLAAQNPGALRLGGGLGGQSLDDLLRALRLQPVLQLGVSYAF